MSKNNDTILYTQTNTMIYKLSSLYSFSCRLEAQDLTSRKRFNINFF